MPKIEQALLTEMCWTIHDWDVDTFAPVGIEKISPEQGVPPESRICKVLQSALFSAKVTLSEGVPRRVFIQDLANSLNRKGILVTEKVDIFEQLGYEYMEGQIRLI